jgi:hypothetical protein
MSFVSYGDQENWFIGAMVVFCYMEKVEYFLDKYLSPLYSSFGIHSGQIKCIRGLKEIDIESVSIPLQ